MTFREHGLDMLHWNGEDIADVEHRDSFDFRCRLVHDVVPFSSDVIVLICLWLIFLNLNLWVLPSESYPLFAIKQSIAVLVWFIEHCIEFFCGLLLCLFTLISHTSFFGSIDLVIAPRFHFSDVWLDQGLNLSHKRLWKMWILLCHCF